MTKTLTELWSVAGLGAPGRGLIAYDVDFDGAPEVLVDTEDALLVLSRFGEITTSITVSPSSVLAHAVGDANCDGVDELILGLEPNIVALARGTKLVLRREIPGVPRQISLARRESPQILVETVTHSLVVLSGRDLSVEATVQLLPPLVLVKPLDINGDGEDEVLVLDGTGVLSELRRADSKFVAGEVMRTGISPLCADVAKVRDELVLGVARGTSVLLCNATRGEILGQVEAPFDVTCVRFADVDGDGRPELIVTSSSPSNAGVQVLSPEGEHVFSLEFRAKYATLKALGDVDGDRELELILINVDKEVYVVDMRWGVEKLEGIEALAVMCLDLDSDRRDELIVRHQRGVTAYKLQVTDA